jgi:peroxiredoxin Q/BCP
MKKLADGEFYDTSLIPLKMPGDRLEDADRCPDFFLSTINDAKYELSSFADRKLWLAFYRYAGCPLCRSHFDEVIGFQKKLDDAGVTFIAIFDCARTNIPAWGGRLTKNRQLVVSDENKNLYDLFGVGKSWKDLFSVGTIVSRIKAGTKGYTEEGVDGAFNRIPAHFLVYPGGKIAKAHYGKHAGDQISWKNVVSFMDDDIGQNFVPADLVGKESHSAQTEVSIQGGVFEVHYRWKVKKGDEAQFQKVWADLQQKIAEIHPNSMGAKLSREPNGDFIAVALWKSQKDWQEFWVTKELTIEEVALIRFHIAESYPATFSWAIAE